MTEGGQNEQDQGGLGGVLGNVTDQAGQAMQRVQDTAGRAVDQVGQAAQGLASGTTRLLSKTTNEAGQTVQRTVDESGNIVESTLDEARNVVNESLVGNLVDLPSEEEHTDEGGRTVRTIRYEPWKLLHLTIGPDGNILDLSLPDPGDTVEEITEEETVEEHSEMVVAEEPAATTGAKQKAEELGVDLSQVEGTGPEGRITITDVTRAANQG